MRRLPGTGLARQISGRRQSVDAGADRVWREWLLKVGVRACGWRGETVTHEKIQQRVDHDLYYIENWSILLDIYILAITPAALFKTTNAF